MKPSKTQYAIARHKKQKTVSDVRTAARHNDRTLPPKHAKPGTNLSTKTLLGETTNKGVIGRLMAKISTLRKQPKANGVRTVEVVLTASPEFFEPDINGKWNPKKVAEFEKVVTDFARAEYGDNLLQLMMHYDESSPHAHVLTMPIVDNRLCCKEYTSRSNLRAVQTRWADACKVLGLSRGVHRPGVSHTTLKDFYQAMNTPLPDLPPRPKKPNIDLKDRILGDATEKLAAYDKALAAWSKVATAYKDGLAAKARIVDVIAPELQERERAAALERQKLVEDRIKFGDMKLRYESTRDLDARSKMYVIKALPRVFLEEVLRVKLPGKRDPVDVLRDMGMVKNMAEGVDYIYAQLDAYGRRLNMPKVPVLPSAAPGKEPTLAFKTPEEVPSM